MFPSKGTPGGCGMGVVMVVSAAKSQRIIGIFWQKEKTGVAETIGEKGGVVACMKTNSDLFGDT